MKKILIYDSGVGGKIFAEKLKNQNFKKILYLDRENFPLGEKNTKELEYIFLTNIGKNLNFYNYVIIACNTMSINLEKSKLLRNFTHNKKIIRITDWLKIIQKDVFKEIKKILVIGTSFTIKSKFYSQIIKKIKKNVDVLESETPRLINSIEHNNQKEIFSDTFKLIKFFNQNKCDCLILGCTHFSMISDLLKVNLKNKLIIDPTQIITSFLNKEICQRVCK